MYTPVSPKLMDKMNKVMATVAYIQKDKRNSGQGYNYASEAAIKGAFHKAFTENGIQFYFSVEGVNIEKRTLEGQKGPREVLEAVVKCTYRFIDIESGEYLEGYAVGVGQDNGDKAVYKAITGALKYAITSNFLVETGDGEDPENDEKTDAVSISMKNDPKAVDGIIPQPGKPTCMTCQTPLTEKVATFSFDRFGMLYCFDHQPKKGDA